MFTLDAGVGKNWGRLNRQYLSSPQVARELDAVDAVVDLLDLFRDARICSVGVISQ